MLRERDRLTAGFFLLGNQAHNSYPVFLNLECHRRFHGRRLGLMRRRLRRWLSLPSTSLTPKFLDPRGGRFAHCISSARAKESLAGTIGWRHFDIYIPTQNFKRTYIKIKSALLNQEIMSGVSGPPRHFCGYDLGRATGGSK